MVFQFTECHEYLFMAALKSHTVKILESHNHGGRHDAGVFR